MRVIDLLIKRANGEEAPKKIRIEHWCYKFEWVEHLGNYYDKEFDIDLTSAISMNEELNYKVHILNEEDEEAEFENIEEIEHQYIYGLNENEEKIDDRVSRFEKKINQLIKNQKKIIAKLGDNK